MRAHRQEMIAATAREFAGKVHTEEAMHAALFQLVLDIVSPARLDVPCSMRRMPLANEVLPRHQRATWARGKTVHDAGDDM